jgi:hypothetical protein
MVYETTSAYELRVHTSYECMDEEHSDECMHDTSKYEYRYEEHSDECMDDGITKTNTSICTRNIVTSTYTIHDRHPIVYMSRANAIRANNIIRGTK